MQPAEHVDAALPTEAVSTVHPLPPHVSVSVEAVAVAVDGSPRQSTELPLPPCVSVSVEATAAVEATAVVPVDGSRDSFHCRHV